MNIPKLVASPELLITTLLLGALGAISVHQYSRASNGRDLSKAFSDLRIYDVALRAYQVDQIEEVFPLCHNFGHSFPIDDPGVPDQGPILSVLTTPIAYLCNPLEDPFVPQTRVSEANAEIAATATPVSCVDSPSAQQGYYFYYSFNRESLASLSDDPFSLGGPALAYIMQSAGPDLNYYNLGGIIANDREIDTPINLIYDPTNGTISFGSIYRTGGSASASANYAAGQGLVQAIQTQD